MPVPVQARIEREQKALWARAKAAAKLPRTRSAGCVPVQIGAQHYLGPPVPKVRARIIGHDVEIVFEFKRMPSSDACRPFVLTTVINGVRITNSGPGAIYRYQITASRARVVSDLPWYAKAPYRLIVVSETILGLRSPYVRLSLRCPGTGDIVKGCLRGYAPPLHGGAIPPPVLPLRGVDASSLQASLQYVVAGEQTARPVRVRCPSVPVCEISYIDPDFLKSPYRVRYRIVGEQLRGCWMAWKNEVEDDPPYEDAWQGRQQLAGCVAWLR